MLVQERMTRHPITVPADMPVTDALRRMREERVRRFPVVDKESHKLLGIVTEKELLYASPSPATSLSVHEIHYLLSKLKPDFVLPYDDMCKHEFVLSGKDKLARGVRTNDIAKRLMDFGFHPPTVYFPLIVEEALMIEPTETESRETLDRFAGAMKEIALEIENDPDKVKGAPYTTPVRRVDEVLAARNLDVAE